MLDTGDAFLKRPEDAANAPLAELVAATMVEGLGTIGYDAMNLGAKDLRLGPDLLRTLAAGASFPLISANVVDAGGKAPFAGRIVKEIDGFRIGIFGIAGTQRLPAPSPAGRDLTVQDPTDAARRAVADLRRSSQLVVALSQLGIEEDARLARAVPGIDVILGGFSRTVTPVPRIEGSTLILHAGGKGMHLGRLELQVLPGREGAWTARAAARENEARVYDWRLVALSAALPDHPGLAALLERHRETMRSRNIAELAAAAPPHPPEPRAARAAARPAYVGAAACGACHPLQLRQWSASKHARALAALERKRQELNPECVGCHVTAYREIDGYQPGRTGGVDLANVQCEACHGFGREHRGKGRIRGRVPEAVCRRCHTTENSPTFKYEPYLKLLGEHAARYFERSHGPSPPAPQR